MSDATRPLRVWVLFRQHDRADQGSDDPGRDLEGFMTVRDALLTVGHRFGTRQGTMFYTHPDRADEDNYQAFPDLDKATGYAAVWLKANHPDVPPGWEPDATSQPDERWTAKGLLGVERTPY